jgi:hypothetical protein
MLSASPSERTRIWTCWQRTGQENRGLAGRVATADYGDLLATAQPGFQRGGGVIHAGAKETLQVVDVQRAILCAAGDQHDAGPHRAAFRQLHQVRPAIAAQAASPARRRSGWRRISAPARVRDRPARGPKCRSGIPGSFRSWNWCRPVLLVRSPPPAARPVPRRRVYRGRKPGGAGAHDQQVVHVRLIDLRVDAQGRWPARKCSDSSAHCSP